jgi:hypothetical protein
MVIFQSYYNDHKRLSTTSFKDTKRKGRGMAVDSELIETLLKRTNDLTVKDYYGNTLLHHYISTFFNQEDEENYSLLDLIVQKTNQINTQNSKGETPIFGVTNTNMDNSFI